MSSPDRLSRREFAGRVAAGAAPLTSIAAFESAGAQEKKVAEPKPPSPVDRQLELIQQQYSDKRLDAAALAEIREDLETQAARSLVLSAFRLTNGDEPGYVVRAWRKDE
ncbi:MAG: hypothetical protein HY290_01405 [Planctomycetia bacterium]|nr:hypothetical protein [Planctomycetia bacterium]